ncbi:uncharacterized protein CcaverHIS019_0205460 [Cutaneotrichosporon cavernicola]|uniref:CN hydrolase domain-containing protein n=1 Tax=Cutaneotrichosporon cavernicola TaxID=279322 RepID=A0AA48I0X7_9TREE|nr:uncharacterized protein CcaverHIS019_0205460 [Cutaneotrichosporon cavernicola]BEI89184.1 hypothetical protein CcaverHIS019_0205460 [Cutaneotrichosporon cavernicola]BEI96960.1 hypothetical protein CcaverHIS631_0205490 [Cutaneotrichosporon cavernicola]BEJ04734.1 hypothetical protein CcaverHIS641_0205510 [Cutaneotrichosporon cavernicola]
MSAPPPSASAPLPPCYRAKPLRVSCVQFDVKLGRVEENAAKVEAMTARLAPGSVDLLVLPEMALSGYMFASPAAIAPYLEAPKTGPTARLATALAARLHCYVVAGYPEVIPGAKITKEVEAEALGVGYNSAVLAGPEGVIGNYRKTFRFETDKTWAREGDGFAFFDLPEPLGRVGLGICMDLNPRDFIAPWNAFELATFAVDNGVDVLVVPMNWLDPAEQDHDSDSDEDDGLAVPPRDPNAPSESNLNYWAARLAPLHDPTPRYSEGGAVEPAAGKDVVFVAANRVGKEEGTTFVGTSCVMSISSVPSRIELVEVCNRTEERVLVAEIV